MGLIGRKLGMTQIFEDGQRIPVTVVELGPNVVVQKKTVETTRQRHPNHAHREGGYNAIQLGFDDKRAKSVKKPERGHFEKAGVAPKRILRELRMDDQKIEEFEVGQELRADVFQEGEWVDVVGTSKGKGFQGVVKRHNMKGAKQATHGTHEQFRHVGSIGCRSTPGEVNKGKRLPGQMGNKRVTVQNVRIVKILLDKNVVLIHGTVPGAKGGYVMVRQAVKALGRTIPRGQYWDRHAK